MSHTQISTDYNLQTLALKCYHFSKRVFEQFCSHTALCSATTGCNYTAFSHAKKKYTQIILELYCECRNGNVP